MEDDLEKTPQGSLAGYRLIAIAIVMALAAAPILGESPAAGVPAAGVPAAGDPAGSETFRGELAEFVDGLAGIEGIDPARVGQLRSAVDSFSPAELAEIEAGFARLPRWKALPGVFASLAEQRDERRQRLRDELSKPVPATAAPAADPPYPGRVASEAERAELERFRSDFLFFVDGLGAFSALVEDPDFDARLELVAARIAELPSDYLPKLREMYYRQAPGWSQGLSGADKSLFPTIPTISCSFGCPCDFNCPCTRICIPVIGCSRVCEPVCTAAEAVCNLACDGITAICDELNGLIGDVNSAINDINTFFDEFTAFASSVFSDIVGVIDTIGEFFTGLWDSIEGFLSDVWNAFLDLVPTTPEDVLSLLGLDVITSVQTDPGKVDKDAESFWLTFADGFVQGFTLSVDCDLIGLTIGQDLAIFGVVGTPRAEWICKRGLDWLTEFIWEFVPDDTASLTGKLIYGTLVHYPIKFFCRCLEAQSTVCFDNSQNDHRTLLEALLDQDLSTRATGTGMEALRTQLETLRTTDVGGVQSDVDTAAGTTSGLLQEVTALGVAAGGLATAQQDQQTQIDDFEAQVLRIRIEENLLQPNPGSAVASFQSPEMLAGFLATVRAIVVDTVAMNAAAGESTFDAQGYLGLADKQASEGAFEKAYENYGRAYREAVKFPADFGGKRRQ